MTNYLEAINAGLYLLCVIAAGFILGHFGKIKHLYLVAFNQFVFFVALPSAILHQVWTQDVYSFGDNIWDFINTWIVFRLFMLASCTIVGLLKKHTLGDVTVSWLGSTWASTILIGQPFLRALYGPPAAIFGLWAAISSWIAQLPWMLTMFELYTIQRDSSTTVESVDSESKDEVVNDEESAREDEDAKESNESEAEATPESKPVVVVEVDSELKNDYFGTAKTLSFMEAMKKVSIKKIACKLLSNPIILALIIGWTFTLIPIKQPGRLDPPMPPTFDATHPLYFIVQTLTSLAPCATPLAMFAIGLFASLNIKEKGLKGLIPNWKSLAVFILIKEVIGPLIIIPIAMMFGLEGIPARAAVIVASTPLSMAAFAISKQYKIGTELMSTMIMVGSIIVLPLTLFHVWFMDVFNIFPVA
ncbi:hypothetical protein GEMRC1_006445 [Eukaryota sp. GEM-RC1]